MGTHVASDEIELFRIDNLYNCQNPLLSNDSFDCDDTLSVVHTSRSASSSNVFNLRTNEVTSRLKYKSVEPTETNIGSACVTGSSNVTFGTIFNGPVAIKNLITDRRDVRYNTNFQFNRTDQLNTTEPTFKASNPKRLNCFGNKRRLILFIIVNTVVLVTGIFAVRYYLYNGGTNYKKNPSNFSVEPVEPPITTTITVPSVGVYELINRSQYGALPPKENGELLKLPIKRIIIGHTATPICTEYADCASRVRQIQDFHMNKRGWHDIGYNFLVGGVGRVYEGRGYKVGAHTKNYNRGSLFIAFIGNFSSYKASQKQLQAAQRIIDDGIKRKKIHPLYVLYGQKQLRDINSPGLMLYNQIISWPHWSKEIISS